MRFLAGLRVPPAGRGAPARLGGLFRRTWATALPVILVAFFLLASCSEDPAETVVRLRLPAAFASTHDSLRLWIYKAPDTSLRPERDTLNPLDSLRRVRPAKGAEEIRVPIPERAGSDFRIRLLLFERDSAVVHRLLAFAKGRAAGKMDLPLPRRPGSSPGPGPGPNPSPGPGPKPDTSKTDTVKTDTTGTDTTGAGPVIPPDPKNLHDPLPADDTLAGVEDETLRFPSSALLANDKDGDAGQTLKVGRVFGAVSCTVRLSGGNVEVTPGRNFSGAASFRYEADDGAGRRATARALIAFAARNDAPEFVGPKSPGGLLPDPDSLPAEEGRPFSLRLFAADVDSDSLDFVLLAGPPGARLAAAGGNAAGGSGPGGAASGPEVSGPALAGLFTFTPAFGSAGKVEVRALVRDRAAAPLSDTLVLSVTVSPYARPSVNFAANSASAPEGGAGLFTVNLSASAARETRVFLSVSGTARPGLDHDLKDTLVLTFRPGEVSRPVSFQLQEDGRNEGDETVVVAIDSAAPALLGPAARFTLTVKDGDPLPPKVLVVDAAGKAGGDGKDWSRAFASLDEALAAARSGDTVWVAEGVYKPGSTQTGFVLRTGITLLGGFAGGEPSAAKRDFKRRRSILSGDLGLPDSAGGADPARRADNAAHVVSADAGTLLDGFTLEGGHAERPGSASNRGGGFYAGAGGVTVQNCVFRNNHAAFGGAFFSAAVLSRIRNCLFHGNRASTGGGAVYAAEAVLENTVISDNRAASQGGGILFSGGNGNKVVQSVVYGNTAPLGGGLFTGSGTSFDLAGSVFYANAAGGAGAANQIRWTSQGGTRQPRGAFLMVQDRQGEGAVDAYQISNIDWGWDSPSGHIDLPPRFQNPASPEGPDGFPFTADDGFVLQAGSPGIDAGATSKLPPPAADITGSPRPAGAKADIGAYER